MRGFQQHLLETFDSNVDINWMAPRQSGTTDEHYGQFVVNKNKFVLIVKHNTQTDTMTIEFVYTDNTGWHHLVTGKGDQLTVFATVLAGIRSKLSQYNSKYIRFSAVNDRDSRGDLYQRMAKRFGKEFGYSMMRKGNEFLLTRK